MIELLFVFGSWMFWCLLGLISLIIFYQIENKKGSVFNSIVLAFTGFLIFKYNPELRSLEWPAYLLFGLGYFFIGGGWSLWKWLGYVKKLVVEYNLDQEKQKSKGRILDYDYDYKSLQSKCKPSENKELIYSWITFWPWSFVWTVISEYLKNITKYVYESLQSVYQAVSDKALESVPKPENKE